jgi:hypothetical protein
MGARPQFIVQPDQPAPLIATAPIADCGSADSVRRATSRLDLPAPDSRTIWARRTSECGMLWERTIARNCPRSASEIANAVLGLPILATSPITIANLMSDVMILMGH